MDLSSLRQQQQNAPKSAGVYFFRDEHGHPLYIGKAKSLRHRLGSHLSNPSTRGGIRLLEEARTLDYVLCDSEWQALLLEQELVSAQQPTYNVALRFGRRYPRVGVSVDETFPRVYAASEQPLPGRRYFGPYEGASATDIVNTLTRLYHIRSCEGTIPGRASGSPCLDFHIHRCEAPCVGFVSKTSYREMIEQVIKVLSGDWSAAAAELEARMRTAAATQHFEDAAHWRDDFLRLQQLCGHDSKTVFAHTRECDVIAFTRNQKQTQAHVQLLRIREHVLAGRESLTLDGATDINDASTLREILLAVYERSPATRIVPAAMVIIPESPEDALLLTQLLSEKRGGRVSLRVPKRGQLLSLLDLAQRNAEAALQRSGV